METPLIEMASDLRTVSTRLVRNLRQQSSNTAYSHVDLLTMGLLHEHGSLLPSELAQLERVSAQAISQVIQRLHADGCLVKTIDKDDKRKTVLSLTPKGNKILDEIWEQRNQWLVEAIDSLFDEAERATIAESLVLLKRLSEYNK